MEQTPQTSIGHIRDASIGAHTSDFDFDSNVSQEQMRLVIHEKDRKLSGAKKVIEIEKRHIHYWIMFFTLLLVMSQAIIQFVNAIQDGPPWSSKVAIGVCSAYALAYEGIMKKMGIEKKFFKLETVSKSISRLRAETQTHLSGITTISPRNMYHIMTNYSSIFSNLPVIRRSAVKKFEKFHPDDSLPDAIV